MADSLTATILVTDLVGSTDLRVRLGEEQADDLRRTHDDMLTRAIESAGGTVVKGLGDGVLAMFPSASDAVGAAVAIQQGAYDRNRVTPEEPLDIRIGLSAGDVSLEEGDCFGTPVVEASRLCAAAMGGQILAADLVRLLTRGRGGHAFTAGGDRALKGLPDPVPVAIVGWDPPESRSATVPFPYRLAAASTLPFVGRSEAFDVLIQAWNEAAGGPRRAVFVSGEPGIGKTRLTAELARTVYEQGGIVLYGRCDEDLGLGFQPFVEALDQVVQSEPDSAALGRHSGDLVRLVPDLPKRVPGLSDPILANPETERHRLLDAVAAWLGALSGERGVVLVLDDLHWAEKPTLLMLRHLLRSPESLRLLVLATYRDTDLDRTRPLGGMLADLYREPGVRRLALSGLDVDEVAELLANAAGDRIDERARDLAKPLCSETQGNPFFVQEIILSLVESGGILQRDGVWTTDFDLQRLNIPEGVRQAVGSRLNRLGDETNVVLSVASVIAPAVDVDLLAEIAGVDHDAVLDALDDAAAASLVQETTPGTYEFRHALVRSIVYDELSATRRSLRHRQVAEVLAQRAQADPAALVYHFQRAGTVDSRLIDYAVAAGEAALEQLAFDKAVTFFAVALEAAEDLRSDASRRCDLAITLGIAQRLAGIAAHRNTLLDAATLAQELGDPQLLARAALANHRGMMSGFAAPDQERLAVLRAALEALGEKDSPWRARLLATLASEVHFGSPRPELADEAVDIARRLGDEQCLLEVSRMSLYSASAPERTPVVLAEIPALRQLAERVGSSDDIFWVCLFGSSYYTQMANLDEAKDLLQRAAEVAEATRNPTFQWLVANYRCGLKMISDDVADVEAGSIEALQLGTDSDQPDAPYWFAGQLFFVREVQGRMDEILDLIHSQSEETLSSPVWQGGLALALVRDGQLAGASAHIDKFLLERGDDPFPRDAAWLITHTIFGMAVAAAGSVGQAVREYEHLIPFAGRFGTGGFTIGYPVSLTLAVLAARAGRPEQAVQHFSDALEQAERLGANIWTARTQLEWGRFLLNGGSSEAARELLVEAKRAAERMGALGIAQEAAVLLDQ